MILDGYPPAERHEIVERLHGHLLADPYRWLEDPGDPRTAAWSAAQDELARSYLDSLPGRDALHAQIAELVEAGSVSVPVWRAGRAFFTRRQPGQEHAVLYVREADGGERALVDPGALDPTGATTLDSWSPSIEGERLAYQLSVGGDEDKVWRSALHFPLASIPRGSVVLSAALYLSVDGVCLGPRSTEVACPARAYTVDVHPIFGADWFHEREVDIGPLVSQGSFWAHTPQRLAFDLTDQVIEWVEYGAPNDGLLLKLAEGEEEYVVGGPRLPSSEFANPALRPMLEVSWMSP